MTYEIYTDNAEELIKTIFTFCKEKTDLKGNSIDTWAVVKTKDGTKVLIHKTDQWEDKCNIHLDASEDNDVVIVSPRYWSRFPKELRSGTEFGFVLGRFTELLLIHFKDKYSSIEICQ